MKILYLTVPSFFDLEISLIRELKKLVDIKVVMIVSPESMHLSAFSIDELEDQCDLIPANKYKGMEKYEDLINLDDWIIANNPNNSLCNCFLLSNKIKKYYQENDFSFFHGTTNCKTSLFLLPFIYRLKNKVLTKHDPIQHNKKSFLYEFFKCRLVHKSYENFIFLSDALTEKFCKHYSIKKESIYYSRLSVYDYFRSFKDSGNNYGNYVLFFGRISEYKGVDVLIDAFMQTKACKDGKRLVIAGRGKIKHSIESLPTNIIVINDYISNDVLSNLIRHSSFVVLPYISATQSGCVMSAYAFNKPILATNVGDLPKSVIDGETGMICNPNDINKLASSIDCMFASNLHNYSTTIKKLYQDKGELSWHKAALDIVNIYKKISNDNSL